MHRAQARIWLWEWIHFSPCVFYAFLRLSLSFCSLYDPAILTSCHFHLRNLTKSNLMHIRQPANEHKAPWSLYQINKSATVQCIRKILWLRFVLLSSCVHAWTCSKITNWRCISISPYPNWASRSGGHFPVFFQLPVLLMLNSNIDHKNSGPVIIYGSISIFTSIIGVCAWVLRKYRKSCYYYGTVEKLDPFIWDVLKTNECQSSTNLYW